jgi:3-methyladenine DNA glycosylase AlkD
MQDRTNDLIAMIRIIARKPPCQPEWQEQAERDVIQAAYRLEEIIRDIAKTDKSSVDLFAASMGRACYRSPTPQGSDQGWILPTSKFSPPA